MNKTKIIVVEDNIVYCEYVCNMLSREGYRNMKAYHLSTAKKHLQQATDNDIVVADLRLPDGSGIDLLCWMRKEGKMQPFIIMTDYAEVNTAVESMKLGSIDYIPKQLVEDKLVPLIRSILKERQAGQRRMPIFAREGSAFQKIMHRIRLVAATDMSVMIFGENGTGKEHIAHHLHDKSKRTGKPFVAVDCGSLSKNLRRRHSSDTSRERLQVRTAPRKGISMKRKAARCFWTRWETSRWKPNRCCSVPYKRGGIARLVTNRTGVSMSASSPPPTRIWK